METLNRESLHPGDQKLLKDALSKDPSNMKESEKAVIRARQGYLTAFEKETFKEILEEKKEKAPEMTVAQIKEELKKLEVEIPEGVTKKDDLMKLLEESKK